MAKKLELENSAMEKIDRLSELPDPLISQILDRLGLEEAAKTSVLSKQWRYLWTNVPFAFTEWSRDMEDIQKFVARVNAAIAPRRGPALHRLYVSFPFYNRFTADVNSWLDFASQNGVKNICLYMSNDYIPPQNFILPQIIYTNPSLETLTLSNCIAPPATRLEWPFLKSLSLMFFHLPQQVIGEILSRCPLLKSLHMVCCFGFNRLEIRSRSFALLDVNYSGGGDLLEISAPYLRQLKIGVSCVESYGRITMLRLQDVRSVESVYINVMAVDFLSKGTQMNSMMRNIITHLFQQLGHVKTLQLSAECTQVVSCMATNGCQFPQLRVEDLDMEAESYAQSMYGVVAVVESSPNLRNLDIRGSRILYKDQTMIWGEITRDDLNCDLLHLKTVKIADFFDNSDDPGEPTFALAKILLKRAPFLEKMKICKFRKEVDDDLIKKTLLNYPKSSTKVSLEVGTF